MTNLFKRHEVDAARASEGVPLDIDGATFFLRRAGAGNRGYRYALAKAALAFRSDLIGKSQAEAEEVLRPVGDEITMRAFADAVFVRWENVEGRDGAPLDSTPENFVDLMRSCPEVWDRVLRFASDIDNFRPDAAREDGAALGKS